MSEHPQYYLVIPCSGDCRDHYVLEKRIQAVFADATERRLPALCGRMVTPETNLARRAGVRCENCVDQLALFNPPLVGRRGPPVSLWSGSAPLTGADQ